MSVTNEPHVVSFDAGDALAAVQETVEGTLRAAVEYDEESLNVLYVDPVTLSFYDDEEHMYRHFEEIHSYVNLDLTEVALFTDELFPIADRVRYITTCMDVMKLVRIYVGDEGFFVSVEPDEPVEALVAAVEDAIA